MNRRQSKRIQTHRLENTDTIRDLELAYVELSIERNDLSEQALKIKTETLMEIAAEWEGFKSKALSNQTKRNAAADDRMALDEEYPILISDIREMDAALKEMAINISFEKRQFARETDHIEDLRDIRSSWNLLARDFHAITMYKLGDRS